MTGNLEFIKRVVGNKTYQHLSRPRDNIEEVNNCQRGKAYRDTPGSQKAIQEGRRNRRPRAVTQVLRSMLSYSLHVTINSFDSQNTHQLHHGRVIEHNATDMDGTCTEHRIQTRPSTTNTVNHDNTANVICGKERFELISAR